MKASCHLHITFLSRNILRQLDKTWRNSFFFIFGSSKNSFNAKFYVSFTLSIRSSFFIRLPKAKSDLKASPQNWFLCLRNPEMPFSSFKASNLFLFVARTAERKREINQRLFDHSTPSVPLGRSFRSLALQDFCASTENIFATAPTVKMTSRAFS